MPPSAGSGESGHVKSSSSSVIDSMRGSIRGLKNRVRGKLPVAEFGDDAISSPVFSENEVTIVKVNVRNAAKDRKAVLRVTNRAVYDSSGQAHEILDIHSVKADVGNPHAFYISWFKSRKKMAGSKVMGVVRSSMSAAELLVIRRFVCDSEADQAKLILVLEFLVRQSWQALCETSSNAIVYAPEIYQMHSFVVKVNRKGQCQERALIVSNSWIYNAEVTHSSTDIKEVKWSVPIKGLHSLKLCMHKKSPALTISLDEHIVRQMFDKRHRFGRSELPKARHIFCFSSGGEVDALVTELRRLYCDVAHKELLVEQDENFTPSIIDDAETAVGEDVKGFVLKYRKNMKGKPHRRFMKLSSFGMLQWAESPTSSTFLSGSIEKIQEGFANKEKLERAFIVTTSSKTLFLVADSSEDYDMWVKAIKLVLVSQGKL